jgi:hypothetical protein
MKMPRIPSRMCPFRKVRKQTVKSRKTYMTTNNVLSTQSSALMAYPSFRCRGRLLKTPESAPPAQRELLCVRGGHGCP